MQARLCWCMTVLSAVRECRPFNPSSRLMHLCCSTRFCYFVRVLLTVVNLQSGNQLTGTLPSGLSMPFLAALDLSHNQLTGTLPRAFYPMLQLMALSHNKFTGQIPAPLGANQLGSRRICPDYHLLWHAMLCCAMSCHVIPCCAATLVLCYSIALTCAPTVMLAQHIKFERTSASQS